MKRLTSCAVMLLLLLLTQCGGEQQKAETAVHTVAANAIAVLANSAGDTLRDAMKAEGIDAKAHSVTEAEWALKRKGIEDRWQPVWDAFDAFAIAHETYTDQIEAGGAVAISPKLRDRYCEVRELAHTAVETTLPDHPTEPCR